MDTIPAKEILRLARQFIDGAVKPRAHDERKTRALYNAAISERDALAARAQARQDLYNRAIFMPRSAQASAIRAFETEAAALKTAAARDEWLTFVADHRPVVDLAPPIYTKYLA